MLNQLLDYAAVASRHASRLNHEQWVLVFLGVLLVGFLCMRGFGSRANY